MNYPHLGGHLDMTHLDEGALKWLMQLGCRSLLDVGCSVGGQVALAHRLGMNAYGIEGDYSLLQESKAICPERMVFTDITKVVFVFPAPFDATWCIEVAEHIEEQYTGNLLSTISANLMVDGKAVMTANQGISGFHHVNLKPREWWIDQAIRHGLIYDEAMTAELKSASTMAREFIQNTGMVFRKRLL